MNSLRVAAEWGDGVTGGGREGGTGTATGALGEGARGGGEQRSGGC